MENLMIFKVCDATRTTRMLIAAFPTIDSLLAQASVAFQNEVLSVYTEVDGCRITTRDRPSSSFNPSVCLKERIDKRQQALLMLLGANESWNPQQMPASSQEQIEGGTSRNSNEEHQTYDQKVAPHSISLELNTPAQSAEIAVATAPDIIAMDLLSNIEEDVGSIAEENTIINTLASITFPDSEFKESTMINESQTAVSSNMHSEPPVATTTVAEDTNVPQVEAVSSNMQNESPVATTTVTKDTDIPHGEASEVDVDVDVDDQSEPEANSDHENQTPNKSHKRKQVNSGVELQKNTKRHVSTDMTFETFQINWGKISDNFLIKLQNLQQFKNAKANKGKPVPQSLRFSKSDTTGFLNEVVYQLRLIDFHISSRTMEKVSKQILCKYPCLDFCDDDGYGGGQSHIDLKMKLVYRNNYLNRLNDQATSKPPMTLKKRRNIRAGTDNKYWEKSAKDCSKELYSKLLRDEPDLLTEEVLVQSQSFVRYTLDEQGGLSSIVNQLPVLRRRKLLNYHFEKATGVDVGCLRNYFVSKRDKIIDYSLTCYKRKQLKDADDDIVLFQFLCSLVGEQFDQLVIKKEIGTRMTDVTLDVTGPVIVAIDIEGAKRMYYVFAEGTRLSEGTTDIVTAMQDIMTVHFVYNFMYMKCVSKFLELIQEYFLKIIPITGSKSNAVRVGQRQRIVKKVITALSNHQIPQAGPSHI